MIKRELPNFGFLEDDVPRDVLDSLTKCIMIDHDASQSVANALAGHIEHEYNIATAVPLLEPYILDLCGVYCREFKYQMLGTSVKYKDALNENNEYVGEIDKCLCLDDVWVDFQKKYEYNPIHTHSGVFSFVIWVKIPYAIEDENGIDALGPSLSKANGYFNFHYHDVLGGLANLPIPADSTFEGKIVLFPSTLPHSVNPFFKSDGLRITVSGNVFLK